MAKRATLEDEDEPPKPAPLNAGPKMVLPDSTKRQSADVIPIGKAPKIPGPLDETDSRLRELFQKVNEHAELEPEREPRTAEGASPADLDETARLSAVLEFKTVVGSTRHVLTRKRKEKADSKHVKGALYPAPQRLRSVKVKRMVPTPRGLRKRNVYELEPAPVMKREEIVELRVGGYANPDRTVSIKKTVYAAENCSPLRNPWQGTVAWLGARYFTDPEYAEKLRGTYIASQNGSQSSRKRLNKGQEDRPVHGRPPRWPATSVQWFLENPDGYDGVSKSVVPSGVVEKNADSVNTLHNLKAEEVLNWLEDQQITPAQCDLETRVHNSIPKGKTYDDYRPTWPLLRMDLDSYVREFLIELAEELHPHPEESGFPAQGASEDYEYAATEPLPLEEDPEELLEVNQSPLSNRIEPIKLSPSESNPFVPEGAMRSMHGWSWNVREHWPAEGEPFVKNVLREAQEPSQRGAEQETKNVSESTALVPVEQVYFAGEGEDAVVHPVILENDPTGRAAAATMTQILKDRSTTMLAPDRIIKFSDHIIALAVHGRTRQIDVRSEDGAEIVDRLLDHMFHSINVLYDVKEAGMVSRGEPLLDPDFSTDLVFSKPMASREMVAGDILKTKSKQNFTRSTSFGRPVTVQSKARTWSGMRHWVMERKNVPLANFEETQKTVHEYELRPDLPKDIRESKASQMLPQEGLYMPYMKENFLKMVQTGESLRPIAARKAEDRAYYWFAFQRKPELEAAERSELEEKNQRIFEFDICPLRTERELRDLRSLSVKAGRIRGQLLQHQVRRKVSKYTRTDQELRDRQSADRKLLAKHKKILWQLRTRKELNENLIGVTEHSVRKAAAKVEIRTLGILHRVKGGVARAVSAVAELLDGKRAANVSQEAPSIPPTVGEVPELPVHSPMTWAEYSILHGQNEPKNDPVFDQDQESHASPEKKPQESSVPLPLVTSDEETSEESNLSETVVPLAQYTAIHQVVADLCDLRQELSKTGKLPEEYLDREFAKIYKPSRAVTLGRHRAMRKELIDQAVTL